MSWKWEKKMMILFFSHILYINIYNYGYKYFYR